MRTILEIGGGTTPYFMRYGIPWIADEAYVCLDINEKRVLESKAAVEWLAKEGRAYPSDAQFVVGDGIALPIEPMSMHEVVLSNVLSAPIHKNWNEKGTHTRMQNQSGTMQRKIEGAESEGDLFYRERKPLIQEALRVLKPGGTLTIYTDLLVYGQHSFRRILDELSSDMSLVATVDEAEQARIDEHNRAKLKSGDLCYCFDAEVLPESMVHRFTKIY
jgi:SAM-dependent methyltransferase